MKKYLFILILTAGFDFNLQAQTTNYQVHSLFVLNIAKYSTWPTTSSEFTIAVYGKSKIFDELTKIVAGKNVNGLTIKVIQADDIAGIANAQMVFLADGKSGDLNEILKATESKPVMVIAEREGLFKKGAGFSFVLMDNNTLRYDINHAELEKRQIKVSKNLSGLANTVI
jgi:hypothetical protein